MEEIPTARTAKSKVFDLGNGQKRVTVSLAPVHAPDNPLAFRENQPFNWADADRVARKTNAHLEVGPCWYGISIPDGANVDIGYDYTSVLTGGTVKVRLLQLDSGPVGNHPPPTIEADGVWWRNIQPQFDIHLLLRPGNIETYKQLRGAQAPRSMLWRITESADRSIPLSFQTTGHDNADLNDVNRNGLAPGQIRRRVEMAPFEKGPETVNPDGTVTYTVLERWTGKTIVIDQLTRIQSLSNDVSYPVLIDVTVNEAIAANADDGNQIEGNTWGLSYGGTGDHIIFNDTNINWEYFPGWRFTTVAIPQGATINSAALTLNLKNSGGAGAGPAATVYAVASDDAPAWADGAGPVQATPTTATASFGAWGAGTSGSRAITVTSIIQEIVNRGGWTTGNAIALYALFTPNATRTWTYIDDLAGGATGIATLDIDYTVGGGGGFQSAWAHGSNVILGVH